MAKVSATRVEHATTGSVNRRINAEIMASIEYHMAYPDEIDQRLKDFSASVALVTRAPSGAVMSLAAAT